MNLINVELNEFANKVNSSKSVPGGGSVSAYVGALGIGLARMLGEISKQKKAFQHLDVVEQGQLNDILDRLQVKYQQLLVLVDEDAQAFQGLMQANKSKDSLLVYKATLNAMGCPLQVVDLSYQALQLAVKLIRYANYYVMSDLIGGIYLLQASLQSSIANVKINYDSLTKEQQPRDILAKLKFQSQESDILVSNSLKLINQIMGGSYNE